MLAKQNEGRGGFHALNPTQSDWGKASAWKTLREVLKKSAFTRFPSALIGRIYICLRIEFFLRNLQVDGASRRALRVGMRR